MALNINEKRGEFLYLETIGISVFFSKHKKISHSTRF